MLLKNARVYLQGRFERADIRFEGDKIAEVASRIAGEGIDLTGLTILPGLCDIHTHGCVGCDWSRSSLEDYGKMAQHYAKNGVTSVCATTMSLPGEKLAGIMAEIKRHMERGGTGARVVGVNLEGPFFSKAKKGAQAAENIIDPDLALFSRLQKASGGNILLCDLAPELPGAIDFIERLRGSVVLSMAHTDARYDQAMEGIRAGITHTTHLFNAMTPLTHREPGVVGAAFDSDVTCEMICDGIHLNPATIRIAFRQLGDGRVALISDSMEACGMPNGAYELGGQEVSVCDGLATLHDGTIAGSATNQFQCMRRAIRFGVEPESAVRAATETPARIIGKSGLIGSIAPGKSADLVVVDSDYTIRRVFARGGEIAL